MTILDTKPKIVSYHEMKAISYSELYSMRECVLKGFLKSRVIVSSSAPYAPPTRDLFCGYIFHDLMREFQKYSSLPKCKRRKVIRGDVERLINGFSAKYTDFDFSDYKYWPKIAKAIDSVVNKDEKAVNAAIGQEIKIISSDAKTVGIIDLVESVAEGIQVVDYKSRSCRFGIDLPEKYEQQLHFYALLIQDKFGEFPQKGFIEFFDNERTLVPLDNQISIKLHKKARSIFSKIESVLNGEEGLSLLANRSANICGKCAVSYLCPAIHSIILKVKVASISSMVARVIRTQLGYVELEIESGMTCNSSKAILSLAPNLVADLTQDYSYLFINLVYLGDDKYELGADARIFPN